MMTEGQPFVSIITPVFNMEKYLGECIESVIGQTYENWEYIIVNNKSTDSSLKIAESYAQKDPRIKVVTNAIHLKQMENLNKAFNYVSSNSKYCKVIHADDWLFPECIAKMIEVAVSNPSVGIVGAYRLDEKTVNLDGLPYPSFYSKGQTIARNFFLSKGYFFGSPSSLLIRSDLILKREKIYDESTTHGDIIACLDLLQESDFGFVHQVLTFTRRHNESASSFVVKYQTYRLGKLQALIVHGKSYLTPSEFNKCLRKYLKNYYFFLARMAINLKGKKFLIFHKNELKKLGLQFSNFRLFLSLLWEFLNFRNACRLLLKGLRRTN